MGKLVKPLIFVLLVLSLVAMVLGVLLFNQRETIKTRVQTLENGTEQVAQAIHYPGLNKTALMNPETMGPQLSALRTAARNQYETLEETKETLAKTQDDLSQTKNTLARTEDDLRKSRDDVARLEGDIRTKNAEIARQDSEILQLEDDKLALQNEVELARQETQQRLNELADARAEYESLQRAFDDEVRRNLARSATETGEVFMSPDVTGRILSVNPEWNFVVLDIGSDAGLKANAVMLVHRGTDLVGRIRISDVRKDLSVAEILTDALLPIRQGDNVITPQG